MGERRLLSAGILALVAFVSFWLAAADAHAGDPVAERAVISGNLSPDGTLAIEQEITFGEQLPAELVQRLVNTRSAEGDAYYQLSYSAIAAESDGADLGVAVSQEDDFTVLKVSTKEAKGRTITINYVVSGAVAADPQGNPLLRWGMLQGLSTRVEKVEGSLRAPSLLASMDCTSGPPGSVTKCDSYAGGTREYPQPVFADGPRGVGESVNLEVSLPAGAVTVNTVVQRPWSLDRAFAFTPVALLTSLGVVLIGGLVLFLLHRSKGADVGSQGPTALAEFAPVGDGHSVFRVRDGIRPGQIGTLADERVDPIDITATILDLAIRGHLRIRELSGQNSGIDWSFERLPDGPDDLLPYEVRILDALTPADGAGCRVSTCAAALGPVVRAVQDDLYTDVVGRGWFDRRPDSTRSLWFRTGVAFLGASFVATCLLVAFTSLGLIGLSLIIVALGLVWVAERMPRRTAAGSAALGGLTVLSGVLQTQPTDQIPPGVEYEEISKILPYAVVLGGRDRWLAALALADDDPGVADPTDLNWYHAQEDWHLASLPSSIRAFVTMMQGELFSR